MFDLRERNEKKRVRNAVVVLGVIGLHVGALAVAWHDWQGPETEPTPEVVVLPPFFVAKAPAKAISKASGDVTRAVATATPAPTPESDSTPAAADPVPVDESRVDADGAGDPDGLDGGDPNGTIGGDIDGTTDSDCIGCTGTSDRGPVDIGPIGIQPTPLYTPQPHYPALARRAGIEGRVVLEILVGVDGQVQEATVVKGQPPFDEPAVLAVKKWRFQPLHHEGRPIAWKYRLTVRFELN